MVQQRKMYIYHQPKKTISSIGIVNEDTVTNPMLVKLYVLSKGMENHLLTAAVPINSGTDGSPSYELLNSVDYPSLLVDQFGNPSLNLDNGEILLIKMNTTIESGKKVYITIQEKR